MIQRKTKNNRTEDTDMWIKRENNQIKNPHVKEEMPNILVSLKSGAYFAFDCFPSTTAFATDHCVCYLSHYSLLLTVLVIVATQFAVLTKIIIVSKHPQLALLVDYDLTPQLTNTHSY